MSHEVQEALGTTCKDGGSFYVCNDKPSKFLGCCTVDPCKTDDGICPDDKLAYTSYDQFSHNSIGAQSCQSDRPEVQWWTCGAIDTPFMGCCSINPCQEDDGCPDDKIFAARLSDNEEDASVFLPADEQGDNGLSKGAIGGIAAGATIGGLLIIGAIVFFFLRRRKQNKKAAASSYEPYAGQPVPGSHPQSPQMQKGEFSPYSPYPSTYAPTPNLSQHDGGQISPQYWQGSHPGQQGMAPSAYQGSMGSPEMSQGHFRESIQSAYAGHGGGQQFVQELPGTADHPGVSDVSYQDASGQRQAAEMEAPQEQAGEKK